MSEHAKSRLMPLLLASPADMLHKAEHDLTVMKQDLSAYTIFNFFVTCYHITDYIRASNSGLEAALKGLYLDEDFQLAHFLCNRGKHLELRAESDRDHHEVLMGARAGIERAGAARSGEPVRWHIIVEDARVDVVQLGEAVIGKWRHFFEVNHIPVQPCA